MKSITAIILLAIALSGCSNFRDSVLANDKSAVVQKRKVWQSEIEERLKKVDREMDELVANANTDANVAKLKEKKTYYERMAQLQKQRTDTRQKYESLRKSSPQKWEEMKGEVEQAAGSMENAWQEFLQELKS